SAAALPTAPFDSDLCGRAENCIPQPGTSAKTKGNIKAVSWLHVVVLTKNVLLHRPHGGNTNHGAHDHRTENDRCDGCADYCPRTHKSPEFSTQWEVGERGS